MPRVYQVVSLPSLTQRTMLHVIGFRKWSVLFDSQLDNFDVVFRFYMIVCMHQDISLTLENHFRGYHIFCSIGVSYAQSIHPICPTLQRKVIITLLWSQIWSIKKLGIVYSLKQMLLFRFIPTFLYSGRNFKNTYVWVRYFVRNFKGTLWNSTQNILPIHWKIGFLFTGENLRALIFKCFQVFLNAPLVAIILLGLIVPRRFLLSYNWWSHEHKIEPCIYLIKMGPNWPGNDLML